MAGKAKIARPETDAASAAAALAEAESETQQVEAQAEQEYFSLDPDEIAINPKFLARRENWGTKDFDKGLAILAESLKMGQTTRVLVRANQQTDEAQKDLNFELVYGHRRHAAAKMAGIKLLCVFEDMDDDKANHENLIENFSREDHTALEKAKIIKELQDTEKFTNKQVAGYLGVSVATVTQSLKLLTAPAAVQEAVHAGTMSKSTALEIETEDPAVATAVVKKAEEAAKAEQDKAAKSASAKAKTPSAKKAAEAKASAPVRVQTKHVKAAQKELKVARKAKVTKKGKVKGPKSLTRADVLTLLAGMYKAGNTELVKRFILALSERIKGRLSDEQLNATFDDLDFSGGARPSVPSVKKAPGAVPTKAPVKSAAKSTSHKHKSTAKPARTRARKPSPVNKALAKRAAKSKK